MTPKDWASAALRRMRASPSALSITRIAPTRWNRMERPVTLSNAASVSTASLTSFTMSSEPATLDVSPAARGDVCDPSS